MAAPAGATNFIPITSNPASIPGTMPDGGVSVLDGVLEIVEGGDNWEGGAQSFIDGLAADYSDLQITTEADVPVAFDLRQFSQTPGSRELRAGIGLPSLSSAVGTPYKLYRGCTGGPFWNPAGVVPVADGFVASWPSEEAAGDIIDWTSNSLDAVRHGCSAATGQVGNAQQYVRASSQYANAPDPRAFLHGASACTVQAWLYLDSAVNYMRWFDRWFAIEYFSIFFQTSGAQMYPTWQICTNGVNSAPIGPAASINNWHLVTAVFDGATGDVSFYLDAGAPVVTNLGAPPRTLTLNVTPKLFRIGGITPVSQYLDGKIDEFSIATVARSADWIETYYNMTFDNDTFWTVGAEEAVGGGSIIGSSIIGSSITRSGIILPLPDYLRRR